MADTVSTYEAAQNFSGVNAWLHGLRFNQIVRTARSIARDGQTLRVLDLGCGAARAFGALDTALPVQYLGIDSEAPFIAAAHRRFAGRRNFEAVHGDARLFTASEAAARGPFDLIFALETLEHVPAGDVPPLLRAIAALQPTCFVASVPVEIGPSILLKNAGSALVGYSRHREYSLADTLWAGAYRLDKVAPHACGHKGFDWRWLAHTIHQIMPIRRLRRFPVDVLPSAFATSVYIEAAPRS